MVSLGLTKSSSAELYTSGPEVHIQRAHRKFFKWLINGKESCCRVASSDQLDPFLQAAL